MIGFCTFSVFRSNSGYELGSSGLMLSFSVYGFGGIFFIINYHSMVAAYVDIF